MCASASDATHVNASLFLDEDEGVIKVEQSAEGAKQRSIAGDPVVDIQQRVERLQLRPCGLFDARADDLVTIV